MSYLKDITGSEGQELSGKKIALCVTASVSITEAPRIARMFMRHGADVIAVMTGEAQELVSPMIFEWSTGNPPITKITGKVEHVQLVTSREDRVDAIVVAPCTANTISRIALGIADDPVSTLVCTALGTEIPLIIAPAMHEPMARNPLIKESVEKLVKMGVTMVSGKLEESKSKLASPDEILDAVLAAVVGKETPKTQNNGSSSELESIGFLITAGPTREPIDRVRFITNASSGKMGVALAQASQRSGASEVCLVCGPGVEIPKDFNRNAIKIREVITTDDMMKAVLDELSTGKYDVLISAGAPADYTPSFPEEGKISTNDAEKLTIELRATKKIIRVAKEVYPQTFVAAFKAEFSLSEEELIQKARESLERSGADVVIANDVGREGIGFGAEENEVIIVAKDAEPKVLKRAHKSNIASEIIDYITSKELVNF